MVIQSFTLIMASGITKDSETIDLDDDINEFVTVEYQGGAKLYIPVTNLSVLSRYAGGDPDSVSPHKLGTDRWSKAKQKAAKRFVIKPLNFWISTRRVQPKRAMRIKSMSRNMIDLPKVFHLN